MHSTSGIQQAYFLPFSLNFCPYTHTGSHFNSGLFPVYLNTQETGNHLKEHNDLMVISLLPHKSIWNQRQREDSGAYSLRVSQPGEAD